MYCISMKPVGYETDEVTYFKRWEKNCAVVTRNEAEAKEYTTKTGAFKAIARLQEKLTYNYNYFYVQLKSIKASN